MTGIHAIPAEKYHSDPHEKPSLSASIAHVLVSQSPLHAWAKHPRLNPNAKPEYSPEMDTGGLIHAMLLEGHDRAHVIQTTRFEGKGKERVDTGEPVTDYKTVAAREERDAARAAGKIPILAHHKEGIDEVITAFHRQAPENLFAGGKTEQSLLWIEPNGVRCRSRLDYLSDDHATIIDLKTCYTAEPGAMKRRIFNEGLDIQAAFYLRGLRTIDPHCDPTFHFVFVETDQPYAVSTITMGQGSLAIAERQIERAIDMWKECLDSGVWPGYPSLTLNGTDIPAWQEARLMELELTEKGI